ncbi:MAG: response regulator [Planctomycetales bacterium]|nr:response regulator [Planctomycetales bacterium]MCA9167434.1 response regulator [Planctomycetales bacterium]
MHTADAATRLLVVDRDNNCRDYICSQLENAGFPCDGAPTAAIGLDLARREMPSLIIVETQLDACSGFDFVRTVNHEYLGNDIPIIYISATSSSEVIAECHEAGGTYFLSKPIDPTVLIELVDKALWMPHLIRRHVDVAAHPTTRAPRILGEVAARS